MGTELQLVHGAGNGARVRGVHSLYRIYNDKHGMHVVEGALDVFKASRAQNFDPRNVEAEPVGARADLGSGLFAGNIENPAVGGRRGRSL
ncbi:MAG: hypothetical protein BWY39_00086 [Spirochaetes bacterium ADurb.Bin269]|nr:MAG: hypothetical protein BWY39_00086 [Spirochaetes bacterium ADurb.Bin269]